MTTASQELVLEMAGSEGRTGKGWNLGVPHGHAEARHAGIPVSAQALDSVHVLEHTKSYQNRLGDAMAKECPRVLCVTRALHVGLRICCSCSPKNNIPVCGAHGIVVSPRYAAGALMNMTAGSPDSAEKVTPAACASYQLALFFYVLIFAPHYCDIFHKVKDLAELLKAEAIQAWISIEPAVWPVCMVGAHACMSLASRVCCLTTSYFRRQSGLRVLWRTSSVGGLVLSSAQAGVWSA